MESANMAGRNVQTYTLENKNTLRKLATLRNEGQLCDLMFIFPDGSQIEAHKAIVCQYSSVIKARCVDIDQHKLQVLCTDIDNEQAINPSILNIMLDYIYGLSITIRHEYIQDIMRLAIKLNIPEFLGDCDKILFENKALGPSDLMINAQNIKQEQTGSGYETGQASDFGMADQPLVTPSTSFDDTNLQEPIDEKAAKPPGRRKRKATKVVKASVEQLPEPQSDEEDDMMDNPLDDDTDEYEADNFTAIKAEEADSDYNESASPKKRKRSKAKKTTVSTKRSHQKKTATLDPLFCKECDQKFDAYKDAAEHHKGAHNLIVCDVCAKIFDNEADLRRHSVLHSEKIQVVNQTGILVYQCDACPKEMANKLDYFKHMRGHHGEKMLICRYCSAFRSKEMKFYIDHLLRHKGISPHLVICEFCGKKLKSFRAMQLHKASMHTPIKSFKCDQCEKSFGADFLLQQHIVHHKKEIQCDICSKRFSTKGALNAHLVIHTGERKFKCKSCREVFKHRFLLMRHYKDDKDCAVKADIDVPVFSCDKCGQEHSTKQNLDRHKARKHNIQAKGEFHPFKCSLCNKSYTLESDLKDHVKQRHIKDVKCPLCERSFGLKRTLKEHLQSHTGERPHKCKMCDKAYAQASSLHKHNRLHHKIQNKETKDIKIDLIHSSDVMKNELIQQSAKIKGNQGVQPNIEKEHTGIEKEIQGEHEEIRYKVQKFYTEIPIAKTDETNHNSADDREALHEIKGIELKHSLKSTISTEAKEIENQAEMERQIKIGQQVGIGQQIKMGQAKFGQQVCIGQQVEMGQAKFGQQVEMGQQVESGRQVCIGQQIEMGQVEFGQQVEMGQQVESGRQIGIGQQIEMGQVGFGQQIEMGQQVELGKQVESGRQVELGKQVEMGQQVEIGQQIGMGQQLGMEQQAEMDQQIEMIQVDIGQQIEIGQQVEVGQQIELGQQADMGQLFASHAETVTVKSPPSYLA